VSSNQSFGVIYKKKVWSDPRGMRCRDFATLAVPLRTSAGDIRTDQWRRDGKVPQSKESHSPRLSAH
jgi:hypothetical protein